MNAIHQQRDVASVLRIAITKAREGDKAGARRLLQAAAEEHPTNEEVWLWLAGLAESAQDAELYLQTVLTLNPDHARAQEGLRLLRAKQGTPPPASPKPEELGPQEPEPVETPAPSSACPECGMPRPPDTSFCPTCGYMEGQPATENIEELEPVPVPTEVEVGNEMPGLALSIEQAEAIDDCLERIAYESEASCIILADVSGQLISERGRMDGMNTQVLSALAAGELSATKEMARLVGERARFSLLLHEGHERSVYLSHVGEHLLLIIVFDSATPIGLVRIILKKAVRELAPIMERQGAGSAGGSLDGDFARLVGNELDSTLDFTTDED
jgi:predicted regulator of Ras-like GTPase activity (Roadblock/LC7/MglB family)